MQQLLSSLEDERQRQFRRFVGISAAVHAGLALLFWIGPIRHSTPNLPVVERVELVEALASAPAARPAPARPAPAKPKPPPPPPPQAKKVLPKEPAPLPKPKPAEAKPEPKPEAKPEPKAKEPEPAAEQDYEDVLAQLRNEAGEPKPSPVEAPAAATGGGPIGGPGIVDPELARWHREVRIVVTRAWIVPAGFRSESLIAQVEVDLAPTGEVLGTRIKQGSGNPWFDESVERAIEKASPLPAPPEPGEWIIPFDSRDMQ
jgi:colicin import membrane protein